MSDNEFAIRVKNASLSYGSTSNDVISGVDMSVPTGAIYGLLGPSGCGKTTILRCIVGCIRLDFGDVSVFGQKPASVGLQIPGPNVGYMPQEAALYFDLTINEMLIYFGNVFLMRSSEINSKIEYLVTVLDLPEKSRFIGSLSGGQKRRVSFAAAIIHKPRLLILDEPTAGVDPLLREKIWLQLMAMSQKEKTTIIITTQYIEEARRSDRIGFMRKGKIIAEDKPEQLLKAHRMKNLEDVFLSLCSMKRKSTISSVQDFLKFKQRVVKEENIIRTDGNNRKFSTTKTFVNWITVFITLYWKNLLQDIRNPLTICLQYFSPISQILLFALCIGGNPFGINIAIVNKDSSRLAVGNEFLKSIDGVIVNQIHFNNLKDAVAAAKRRKVWAVIEIPKGYSYALVDRIISSNVSNKLVKRSTIFVRADLSDKIVALTTLRTLHNDYILFTRRLLSDYDEDPDVANPIIKIVQPIYGSNTKNYRAFRDFMLPGMILNLTFAMAIAMSSLTLIAERSGQTFERNYVAGVNATQMLMSHIAARITLSALYVVIVVWTPLLLFDIRVKGNVWIATLLVLIQNITGMTCGMLISATCKEIMMAMVTTSGCFMFFLFMSGTLWPVESIPYTFRWMCYISPTTLPTEAFRHILYRNWSITTFGVSIGFGVSIIWTIIFFCSAAKLFRNNK